MKIYKSTLLNFILLFLPIFSADLAYASPNSVTVLGNSSGTKLVQQDGSSFDTLILDKPVKGISYNEFSNFSVSSNKLIIFNSVDSSAASMQAQTIVIKSPIISITNEIEIIGAPANILFISPSVSSVVTCNGCSFSNIGRITFALATIASKQAVQASGYVGKLTALNGGRLQLSNVVSPGLQSLELMADGISVSGGIDLNLRADMHPEGGYVIHPQGSKVVGSGGVSFYPGKMVINYENLRVDSADVVAQEFILNGKIRAASVAILSPENIKITSSADISTISDILSTSTLNGQFYAPIEGIFIQGAGKKSSQANVSNITILGKLSSDNKILIKSINRLDVGASIVAEELSLISGDDTYMTGYVQSELIEIAARNLFHSGRLASKVINVEADNNIYNSYGGDIKAGQIVLKANAGNVINGSRSNKKVYPTIASSLPISSDLTSLKHGIFYDVSEIGTISSNLSAHISGNIISVQAKAFENINPYFLTKLASDDWSVGIKINTDLARQVSLQAENRLEIKAESYILNSSAIIGLNQNGLLIMNTPHFSNERYRLEVGNFVYNQLAYSYNQSRAHDQANVGSETKITAYSPPGRLYSFGEFRFSDGASVDNTAELFTNEFSYFESFGNSHFHQTLIKTIGIELTRSLSLTEVSQVRSCLTYGNCTGTTTLTLADAETLFSIRGNLYGIDPSLPSQSDLVVSNVNAYTALIQSLVKSYLAQYYYKKSESVYGYVSKSAIENGYVKGTAVSCDGYYKYYIPAGPGFASVANCSVIQINKSVDQLISEDSEGKEHPGTGYTPAQITSASHEYLKTLPYVAHTTYNIVFRTSWSKQFNSYTFDTKTSEVIIAYTQYTNFMFPQVGKQTISAAYIRKLPLSKLIAYLPK